MKSPLRIASSVLAAALFVPTLSSQVVLSEIEFTSRGNEGQWIEIVNLGPKAEDLGTWSVHLSTLTPNKPQTYWWAFPKGTTLGPGRFLRVHWLAKVKPSTATDVYTGDTVRHFLFGLFAEPLRADRGALALFDTQQNGQMNTPARIKSWVSWGTTGFKREDLAITAKRWTANSAAPAATGTPAPTLAFTYENILGPNSGQDWFRDETPTPGSENLGGATAVSYGDSCQGTLSQIARQVINGKPVNGNKEFYLGIDRPLLTNELSLVLFGLRGNGALKLLGCSYWLDPSIPFIVTFIPKTGTQARLSFNSISSSILEGKQFSTQWVVADFTVDRIGFTNGAQIRFGK